MAGGKHRLIKHGGSILLALGLICAGTPTAVAQVKHRTTSAHNQITVEDTGGYRLLRFNGSMETRMWLRNPLHGHFEYTEYFQLPLLWNPHAKRVLIMGLGGGSAPRAFAHYYPDVHVDTVELDPAVAKVAKQFFHVKETPKHKIHISDGRTFLRLNDKLQYEAILMDAYTSNQFGTNIPYHLATKEFFKLAAQRLTPNGALAFNVIGTYNDWRSDVVGAMYQTMKSVFPHVYHFPASDSKNIVLIGIKDKAGLTAATLKAKVDALRQARPKLPQFFGQRLRRIRASAPPTAARARVLTDNFSPKSGLLTKP
jgi:spermidine synthase